MSKQTIPEKENQEPVETESSTPTPIDYFLDMMQKANARMFKMISQRHHVAHKQSLIELGQMFTVLNVIGDLKPEYMKYVAGLIDRLNQYELFAIHVNTLPKSKIAWAEERVYETTIIFVSMIRDLEFKKKNET